MSDFGKAHGFKFSDKPYLTPAERGQFRRWRAAGAVTTFGVEICGAQGCGKEVPRGVKTYCSEACWRKEEGPSDEQKEEETGAVDG